MYPEVVHTFAVVVAKDCFVWHGAGDGDASTGCVDVASGKGAFVVVAVFSGGGHGGSDGGGFPSAVVASDKVGVGDNVDVGVVGGEEAGGGGSHVKGDGFCDARANVLEGTSDVLASYVNSVGRGNGGVHERIAVSTGEDVCVGYYGVIDIYGVARREAGVVGGRVDLLGRTIERNSSPSVLVVVSSVGGSVELSIQVGVGGKGVGGAVATSALKGGGDGSAFVDGRNVGGRYGIAPGCVGEGYRIAPTSVDGGDNFGGICIAHEIVGSVATDGQEECVVSAGGDGAKPFLNDHHGAFVVARVGGRRHVTKANVSVAGYGNGVFDSGATMLGDVGLGGCIVGVKRQRCGRPSDGGVGSVDGGVGLHCYVRRKYKRQRKNDQPGY